MSSGKFFMPLSSFSSVMGIEISSIAFYFHGLKSISLFLEYLGISVYIFLIPYYIFTFIKHNFRSYDKADLPKAFTFVAGTAVLGSRLYIGKFTFSSLILLFIAITFLMFLWILLLINIRKIKTGTQFYLMFLPFIGILATLNLFAQLHAYFDISSILIPLSLFIIGNVSWVVTILSFVDYKKYFNHKNLNGFYMIYPGIYSLISFSGIIMLENYSLHGDVYKTIFVIVLTNYIYSIAFSIFLIAFFTLKFIRENIPRKHKISIWGSVFPLGVISAATYSLGSYSHINFLILVSLVYATGALLLIIIAIIQIMILLIKLILNYQHRE